MGVALPDGCKLGSKSLNPILQDLIGRIGYTDEDLKWNKVPFFHGLIIVKYECLSAEWLLNKQKITLMHLNEPS